ncbi:hypothetical protein [Desertivirga arenae]|uniref:hypothetical protein n=1 Tax=Desertivirga arenae TaxID=2810309 RepID=UPI001A95E781|nr:hypothetical protein [Pedobacter sp. SYSU D00823]
MTNETITGIGEKNVFLFYYSSFDILGSIIPCYDIRDWLYLYYNYTYRAPIFSSGVITGERLKRLKSKALPISRSNSLTGTFA